MTRQEALEIVNIYSSINLENDLPGKALYEMAVTILKESK